MKRTHALMGLGLLVCNIWALGGCSSTSSSPALLSRLGESCRVRSDCDTGLACVNQVCISNDVNISPDATECAIIECSVAKDCCPTLSDTCVTYQQQCAAGNQADCTSFQQYCLCDGTDYTCTVGACSYTPSCSGGKACPTPLVCNSKTSKCVECNSNSDCDTSTQVCSSNNCVLKCRLDSDCQDFYRCQNGACVESGCQADRECMALTKNAYAVCSDSLCVVPCQANYECGDMESAFKFNVCLNGQCTYVGCESDKECQLYLGEMGDATHQIVCRPMPSQ